MMQEKRELLGRGGRQVVSAALVLVCTWERVKSLALRCIGLLPETEKWAQRKASWRANVESLYGEAQHVLKNRSCCGKALALNILKFLCLYAAVFLSIRLVGGPALPFWRVQLLSSVMVLISSALPNVAQLLRHQSGSIKIYNLIYCAHLAQFHQLLNYLGGINL